MTTILKTKADVDNLAELRRRKAVLAGRIKEQRQELKQTIQDIREDLKPGKLIRHTIDAFARPVDSGIVSAIFQNPSTLRLVTNFAISSIVRSNTKSIRVLRTVAPMVIQALPTLVGLTKNLFRKSGDKKARRKKEKQKEQAALPSPEPPEQAAYEYAENSRPYGYGV